MIPASMVRLLSASLQHRHLLVRELQRGCSHVLLKVRSRGGARDGQHRGRVAKEPGERYLRWGGVVALGDLIKGSTWPRQSPCAQRVPGNESYSLPLAGLQHRLRGTVREVVAVLDRCHRHYVQRDLQLPYTHVREADVSDLALVPKQRQGPHGVLESYLGIGRVQLVEVYALHLEPTQAALARLAQVLGAPVGNPSTTRACQAALGGDDQIIRVGVECFGDQALGDLGTVGVGGVDEVHSMLYGPPEHAASFLRVLGFTHDTLPRQAHGAEAQAIDEEVAA